VNGSGRVKEILFAKENGVPVPADLDSPYSVDQNLWGRANECGVLENPWNEAPEDAFGITTSPENAPDLPEYVEIEFKAGVPVAINGETLSLANLIQQLNEIAGKHGVGRIDHVENRLVGIKSREIYECPGAITLLTAHKEIEDLT
jgi:argininosuccinate synthase